MRVKKFAFLLSCSILVSVIGSFVASKYSMVIISDNIEALTKNYEDLSFPNGIKYRAIRMGKAATSDEIDQNSYWFCGCTLIMRPVSVYEKPMEFYDRDSHECDVLDACSGTNGVFPYTIKAINKWCWARYCGDSMVPLS